MAKIKKQTTREVTGLGSQGQQSSAKLKKRIRDIKRLLKRDTIPATVRQENERALEALDHELNSVAQNNKTHHLAKKYQMVRFFEKQKATRKVKQADKVLNLAIQDGKDSKTIKQLRDKAFSYKVDLAYTIHFPLDKKYISLYVGGDVTNTQRDEIRQSIAADLKANKIQLPEPKLNNSDDNQQ